MSLNVYQRRGGELVPIGAVLSLEDNLARAVLISLYTDRRAETGELPAGAPSAGSGQALDPRGWWGDSFAGRPIGSRLWLLERSLLTAETLALARGYAEEALGWLVEEGLARAVEVETAQSRPGWLALEIRIDRPEGSEGFRFETELKVP